MTKVLVTKKDGHIVSVWASGHTGFAVEGEDIVCAALSSVMQTALLGILSVAKVPVKFKRDESQGHLEFDLPPLNKQERHDCSIILDTMLAGITDLSDNFSKFIHLKIKNS
ncbi:MAG: ribosomal-processing cysteine protease Prp [Firmicutes bacterium]|nr:ribosomal-processing cysteine protease Prp [Bacillota bacterium]